MEYQDIFAIQNSQEFEQKALEVFQYQFENNIVYRSFCDLLYKHPSDITSIDNIPFLPITFFKSHKVVSTQEKMETIFTSSGTTGSIVSKHYVKDLTIYEASFQKGFMKYYGDIKEYVILALLPSYLERDGSSLVYMVDHLITSSEHPDSGFYLDDYSSLSKKLKELDASGQKVLLIGVSFALLDIVEKYTFSLNNTIIMETGGMKGKRKELIREELHNILKKGFGVSTIHSEYGMTELLSQAYSNGNGLFTTPPWMHILIRDTEDPLSILTNTKTGGLNIIDLSNIYSCSFIATQDLGNIYNDGSFSIVGRFDNSDIRGCNLMAL